MRSENPGKRIVFFIRAESDLDHIAPVIYALLRRRSVTVEALIYDSIKTYDDDYRIRFLRAEFGFSPVHMSQLGYLARHVRVRYSLQHSFFWRLRRWLGTAFQSPGGKLIWFFLRWQMRSMKGLVARLDPARILDQMFTDVESGVVVFDHTSNPFALQTVNLAKARGYRSVSLPHSISHLKLTPEAKAEIAPEGLAGQLNAYDYVVSPNQIVADRLTQDGLETVRTKVLGSVRFCREWTETLRNILPTYSLPAPLPDQKKVVFLLSKQGPYVDWDEVLWVIEHLGRSNRVCLLLKVHPRLEIASFPFPSNGANVRYEIADAQVPTPALIDWSDIVVFWGSSVIYDALRFRKPVIFLNYLFNLHFDFEDTISGWNANSRDGFCEMLNRCLEDDTVLPYTESEAIACLTKYADAGHEQILDGYAAFLESVDDA